MFLNVTFIRSSAPKRLLTSQRTFHRSTLYHSSCSRFFIMFFSKHFFLVQPSIFFSPIKSFQNSLTKNFQRRFFLPFLTSTVGLPPVKTGQSPYRPPSLVAGRINFPPAAERPPSLCRGGPMDVPWGMGFGKESQVARTPCWKKLTHHYFV